jgi:hypothetical protein
MIGLYSKPGNWFGSRPWIYAAFVTVLPALAWLALIYRFSLPIFYEDDWSLFPFILKLRAGTLHFADYWAPYGPHPLIVTRAFFLRSSSEAVHWIPAQS